MDMMALDASTETRGDRSGDLDEVLERIHGALRVNSSALPMTFAFSWCRLRCTGEIAEVGGRPVLRLLAHLGVVPYSAENASLRQRRLELGDGRLRLEHGELAVLGGRRLVHRAELPLQSLDGAGIVTAAIQGLLRLRPYLTLAEAA